MPPKKDDEEDSGMGKMMRDTLFTASNNLVEKMDEKSEAAREKAVAQFGAVVKTYFDLDGAKNAVKVLRLALMSTPRGRQAADKATRDNLWDEMTNASKLVAALRVALDWQPLTWQRITQLVPINPQANIAERWQMFEELASASSASHLSETQRTMQVAIHVHASLVSSEWGPHLPVVQSQWEQQTMKTFITEMREVVAKHDRLLLAQTTAMSNKPRSVVAVVAAGRSGGAVAGLVIRRRVL
jgi:hypothetical protein